MEGASAVAAAMRGGAIPADPGNRAYWICFFLGAGILFPWNAYITAAGAYTRSLQSST
jgi:hypothetical protein